MKPFNIAVFQTTAIIQDQSAAASKQHSLPVCQRVDDDGCYLYREYTQVLNVVVETDTDVLSLVRYVSDLVEFDHLVRWLGFATGLCVCTLLILCPLVLQQIKSHYSRVKIPFPTLTETADKRRSFRQFWTSLSQTRAKSDSEKIERYLQKCSLDPTIRSSTIFRDFFSVQRDEDRLLSKMEIDRILEQQQQAATVPAPVATTTTIPAQDNDQPSPKILERQHQQQKKQSSSDAVVPEQQKHSPDTDPIHLGVSEKDVPDESDSDDKATQPSPGKVADAKRPQLVDHVSDEDVTNIVPNFPSPPLPPAPAPTTAPSQPQPVATSKRNPLDQLEMIKVLGKGCMGKVSEMQMHMYSLRS